MNSSDEPIAHISEDGRIHPLSEHLRKTADLAAEFAGKIGLPTLGALTGLLHDFGKYSGQFQKYLYSAAGDINSDEDDYVDTRGMKGKIDHSSAGAQYIWEALHDNNDVILSLAGQIMSLCVASHHSGLIDCLSPDGTDSFSKRMGKPDAETHLKEVKAQIDDSLLTHINDLLVSPNIKNEFEQCLKKLFEGEKSHEIRAFNLGLLVRFLFSSLIDADRLHSAERRITASKNWKVLIDKFENHLAGLKMRNEIDKVRNHISSSCRDFSLREIGLFQLTVPTGGGKTLASLRFALHHAKKHQMERIIYVIPYTSIIDQNAAIIRKILETSKELSGRVVLEHHSNLTPENDTWLTQILSENWDAPIVFTTSVQFLEALFASGTRGARRMHQLANAVIIFDEIQTIPLRTIHLFNNAINFLVEQCRSTVVFCTATQPLLNSVDAKKGTAKLSNNPELVSEPGKLFEDMSRVVVLDKRKPGGWTEDEVAEAVLQEIKSAGSTLIIVNTKNQAREVYRKCRNIIKEDVYHLSTHMCPAHRLDVLKKVRNRLNPDNPEQIICVSTQLIEAGVDVDFGSVIRYLAGLDSIAQAAGRCNRNGLRPVGRVFVVNPAGENLDKLPDIRIGRDKAERVLDEFRNDTASHRMNEADITLYISRFYQYYFFDRANEMDYPVSPRDVGRDDTLLSMLSANDLSVSAYKRANKAAPPLWLRQSFRAAAQAFRVIDSPTEGVIVPYGEQGRSIISDLAASIRPESKYELLKEAQRFSVNLFPYERDKLSRAGGLRETREGSGILYLDSRYYSEDFGVSMDGDGQMEFLEG
jgi:CRISPR-associated endonuclease/helicase Cas3